MSDFQANTWEIANVVVNNFFVNSYFAQHVNTGVIYGTDISVANTIGVNNGSANAVINSSGFFYNGVLVAGPIAGTAAGGSSTQVQYNKDGLLAGDAGFTYDETSNTLAVGNISAVTLAANVISANVVTANHVGNASGLSLVNSTCNGVVNATGSLSSAYVLRTDGWSRHQTFIAVGNNQPNSQGHVISWSDAVADGYRSLEIQFRAQMAASGNGFWIRVGNTFPTPDSGGTSYRYGLIAGSTAGVGFANNQGTSAVFLASTNIANSFTWALHGKITLYPGNTGLQQSYESQRVFDIELSFFNAFDPIKIFGTALWANNQKIGCLQLSTLGGANLAYVDWSITGIPW
jgi:hypothetical protein